MNSTQSLLGPGHVYEYVPERTELLERDAELHQLGVALSRAATGRGQIVLVRGEVGIGKTVLLQEFVRRTGDAAHVLSGACDDLSTPTPYGPIWDFADDEPDVRRALEASEPAAVHRIVLDLLRRGLRPTLLVLDDMQWADPATLDLVQVVGRRIADSHGVLVLVVRDEDLPPTGGLRAVIAMLGSVPLIRLKLDRLSDEAVRQLSASSPGVDYETLRMADGNPLLITEVLAHPSDPVSDLIEDIYRARLARLSSSAVRLAQLVAVIPTRAEKWIIHKILGDTSAELAECERNAALQSTPAFVFYPHELARVAVSKSLTPEERRSNHQAVVDTLSDSGSEPSRIVNHALEAHDHTTFANSDRMPP